MIQITIALMLAHSISAAAQLANAPSLNEFFGLNQNTTEPFSIAYRSLERQAAIKQRKAEFPYGPDIWTGSLVTGLAFPDINASTKASDFVMAQFNDLFGEQVKILGVTAVEVNSTAVATSAANDQPFETLEDFYKLYQGEWSTSIPNGPFPGVLRNGTNDLTFSMERLSIQPYSVRRLPSGQELAFAVDDHIVKELSGGLTLADLLRQQRLFYVDYRDQGQLQVTPGRFAGACDAFFYLHPKTGDFLPLAIRPNAGSSLIYTPADGQYDWLYAKILFNLNDLWFGQWFHLTSTHEVIDAVYLAALRTMSNQHPVFNMLTRLSLQNFAVRLLGVKALVNPGGPVDMVFAWNGSEAKRYAGYLVQERGGANFSSFYLDNDLKARGLIGGQGPELKHFPFLEDSKRITNSIRRVLKTLIYSYYPSDRSVCWDTELQDWIWEASGPGQVPMFPSRVRTRHELLDLLVHYAYLVSVVHGVLNTNDLSLAQFVAPWHVTSFSRPLPTQKGLTEKDLIDSLPPKAQLIQAIGLAAAFARPSFKNSDRALINMFNDTLRLPRYNDQVRHANQEFQDEMAAFSNEIQARRFDRNGLSQGMPFIWSVLDPSIVPFYLTI
ncbi:hypothetical protein CAC42_374 [Sphaceloma murrayae]|uniref:Manganese lipoxygenase n=1 Tax=Sphaceloma murrayae TaxID=2082308 RepID=A0A2K1R3A8_9PEZI|nr:hypothetical protein CAC42_374 [Sphaceloma murrayae]